MDRLVAKIYSRLLNIVTVKYSLQDFDVLCRSLSRRFTAVRCVSLTSRGPSVCRWRDVVTCSVATVCVSIAS